MPKPSSAPPAGRNSRIIVTVPGDAANDAGMDCELLARGMSIMCINCAHEDQEYGDAAQTQHLGRELPMRTAPAIA